MSKIFTLLFSLISVTSFCQLNEFETHSEDLATSGHSVYSCVDNDGNLIMLTNHRIVYDNKEVELLPNLVSTNNNETLTTYFGILNVNGKVCVFGQTYDPDYNWITYSVSEYKNQIIKTNNIVTFDISGNAIARSNAIHALSHAPIIQTSPDGSKILLALVDYSKNSAFNDEVPRLDIAFILNDSLDVLQKVQFSEKFPLRQSGTKYSISNDGIIFIVQNYNLNAPLIGYTEGDKFKVVNPKVPSGFDKIIDLQFYYRDDEVLLAGILLKNITTDSKKDVEIYGLRAHFDSKEGLTQIKTSQINSNNLKVDFVEDVYEFPTKEIADHTIQYLTENTYPLKIGYTLYDEQKDELIIIAERYRKVNEIAPKVMNLMLLQSTIHLNLVCFKLDSTGQNLLTANIQKQFSFMHNDYSEIAYHATFSYSPSYYPYIKDNNLIIIHNDESSSYDSNGKYLGFLKSKALTKPDERRLYTGLVVRSAINFGDGTTTNKLITNEKGSYLESDVSNLIFTNGKYSTVIKTRKHKKLIEFEP